MSCIYSYHTFLYPFLWENKDKGHSIEDFKSQLNPEDWSEDDMVTSDNKLASVVHQESLEEQCLDYQKFQYFNPAARKALFGCGAGIIRGWKYRANDVHDKGQYRIYHQYREVPYVLRINQIRLRVFNTGVGILIFELEYDLPTGGVEQARRDVRAINELGRRLYPEFLPKDRGSFKGDMFAKAIEVLLGDGTIYREDIRIRSYGALANDALCYLDDPIQKRNLISQIVCPRDDSAVRITPAIDDRMFICCCIMDQDYAEHFLGYPAFPGDENTQRRQSSTWDYKTDWEIGKELFGLINVDMQGSSCQNREMLDKYLEEQLYLRWFEFGTIHAVTNHSMFCISSPEVMDEVIKPFLIEYVQLCILVLAQRASLIAFDARITNVISSDKGREEKNDAVVALSKAFAMFQGQVLIPEATSQIQGIELYSMLQKMLFVDKLRKSTRSQMNNLFEVAQYERAEHQEEQQRAIERAFNVLTVLTIASVWADAYGFFKVRSEEDFNSCLWDAVFVAGMLVVAWLAFTMWRNGKSHGNGKRRMCRRAKRGE